jgi:hypothetical protein
MPRISASLLWPDEGKQARHSAEDERVKKWIEEEALGHFLNAYSSTTGEHLFLIPHESPDFVGEREDGRAVGVELTAIRWDPDTRTAMKILSYDEYMDAGEVLDRIGAMLEKKATKRRSPIWKHPNATILVLMLEDAQLDAVHWIFDPTLSKEWESYGFEEIWVADYTELDAFNDVELFGLHPVSYWGYHRRIPRKPYG